MRNVRRILLLALAKRACRSHHEIRNADDPQYGSLRWAEKVARGPSHRPFARPAGSGSDREGGRAADVDHDRGEAYGGTYAVTFAELLSLRSDKHSR